jgi:hypothetical protein
VQRSPNVPPDGVAEPSRHERSAVTSNGSGAVGGLRRETTAARVGSMEEASVDIARAGRTCSSTQREVGSTVR